jgi:NADPH-dependent glutamate synthase beta subunit-like oxidoreductase
LVDSAKIEPLDDKFVGKNFQLIKNANDVFENLEDRVCYGFGGIIEFGITSRYDKNLLNILRIILERNNNLLISGGVFFGANFNFIDAKNLGFSHVSVCSGSGKSKIPENLSYILKYKGVKFVSEFLMNINLGATKKHSLSNMLIRMPIAVLGGGLSAIDGAMESFLYYKKQINKYVENLDKINYEFFLKNLTNEEVEIHNEFLNHYAILQKMKNKNDKEIMEKMGGVSVFYYKNYTSSNAYKINIEEVNLAKNYGIKLYYNNLFKDIEIDENNYIKNIITKNLVTNLEEKYSIKSLMIAFGYKKNRFIFKNENENLFVFENDDIKIEDFLVKTTEEYNKKYGDMEISVLGDSNPKYEGSVVLAMASGFLAYKKIFTKRKKLNKDSFSYPIFKNKLINKFKAKLKYIKKIDNYYEICIESKQFLQQFFYLKIVGQSTKYFIENIKEGAEIFLVTNLGKNIEFKQKDKILFITSGIQNSKVINIAEIAKRYELEVYSIMIKEDDDDFIKINLGLKSLMVFDKNELNLCYEKIFEIYTHNKINKVFFYTGLDLLKEIIDYLKNKKITNFENFISGVNCVMQCMNFGICSTCVRIYFDGKVINTCEKNYDKVEYIDIDNIKNRNGQSSLLEKIANMVDLG